MTGTVTDRGPKVWYECTGCDKGCREKVPAAAAAPSGCGKATGYPAQWIRVPRGG